MDQKTIGNFIAELRKEKQMTQKQLADQLHLTDKAISKWERGLGYPDITILSTLADLLGVTTSELLHAQRDSSNQPVDETFVQDALQYTDRLQTGKVRRSQRIALGIITGCFAIAAFVCVVCDIAISSRLSWSLYPLVCLLFAWLLLAPFFVFSSKRVLLGLCSLSVFLLPFLLFLQNMQGGGWFWPVAVPISFISLAFLWIVCPLFLSGKRPRRWRAVSVTCLLMPVLSWGINRIVARYAGPSDPSGWNLFAMSLFLFLALLFWIISWVRGPKTS